MELLQVFREITMLKNRSSMHSSLKLTHTSPTVTASRCLSLRSELTCTKFGASGGRKTVKHLTACEKCGLAADAEELELEIEELEPIVAPAGRVISNANETLAADAEELQLEIEELEPIVALRVIGNSSETFLPDLEDLELEIDE